MKRIKNLLLISIAILTFLSGCTSTQNETYAKKFKKIKVGMDITKVESIMGAPDESNIMDQNYMVYYWFIGASSSDDAYRKYEKGIAVTYYCVIFYSDDYVNYKIAEKDDIFSGIWGVA